VIAGEIAQKAAPSAEHADAQGGLVAELRPPFHRRAGGGGPGGWWILPEIEIELEPHEIPRPDIAGWRRERVPERPHGQPVKVRPDWVCEVVSPSNASNDLVRKLRVYHRCQIPHYWLVDPGNATLTVLRWTPDGYLTALTAGKADCVRAEPFAEIELRVGALFGDDEA
jgi:Uma2 family endonuclease